MKSKLIAGLATSLFFLGMAGMAHATYIQTFDLYEYVVGDDNPETMEISWDHTYDWSELGPIQSATLTIVADDVDLDELDYVYLGGQELGTLTQLPEYDNWGYTPGPGGDLTTSIFNIDPSSLTSTMQITLNIAKYYGVEIESSTLEIHGTDPVPEPATMLLFGVGMSGLAFVRKRRNNDV